MRERDVETELTDQSEAPAYGDSYQQTATLGSYRHRATSRLYLWSRVCLVSAIVRATMRVLERFVTRAPDIAVARTASGMLEQLR